LNEGNSGSVFPDGDQTAPDDGWAAFSGTSAAAPQLAGTAALMKQVSPNMSPAVLKAVLAYTAREVVDGVSGSVFPLNAGLPAGSGPGGGTGAGLVDVYSAVLLAYYAASVGVMLVRVVLKIQQQRPTWKEWPMRRRCLTRTPIQCHRENS